MSDQLAEQIATGTLFDTGVSVAFRLHADTLTAADVRSVLTWLDGIADGVNEQFRADGEYFAAEDGEFHIVPLVRFEHGSLTIFVKLKSTWKKLSEKSKDRLTQILVGALVATGTIAGGVLASDKGDIDLQQQQETSEELQMSCPEATNYAIDAWHRAQAEREKYDHDLPLTIEIQCEGQHYVFTVGGPAR